MRDLKEFLQKILSILHIGIETPRHIRHWRIIISLFGVSILALFVWSSYLFIKISNGDMFVVEYEESAAQTSIDRGSLKRVIDAFAERDAELKLLKSRRPSIADPSL